MTRSPEQVVRQKSLSLERKLPLLMSGVLAVILAVSLALTYATLRRSAVDAAAERMRRAARQLASLGEGSTARAKARLREVAADPVVRQALRAGVPTGAPARADTAAVRQALQRLVLPTDSGLPAELWTADGRRLAFVGRDLRAAVRVGGGAPESAPPRTAAVPREGLDAIRADQDDSARYGALYSSAGRTYLWIIAPVRDAPRSPLLGYVVQQRVIAGQPQAIATIQELTGGDVRVYYRNAAAGVPASVVHAEPSAFR